MQQSLAQVVGLGRDRAGAPAGQALLSELSAQGGPDRGGASADPVFVLCGGRSGSTLLRFLLDAHPDLACPPETNLPALCTQLAAAWSLMDGFPLPADRGSKPPAIPDAAIAKVRHTVDMMIGSYLSRRGRNRYCDKSLGTAQHADLLLRLYPGAKFICLYRHPMDVIASGIEACPWGLTGYGFEPYITSTPGNMVLALARFWADNATAILAVQDRFADRCHRVRYEDLVADPEGVADGIFRFLGVSSAPGITTSCFTPERERLGAADYKIWHTSRITADSVGRGWSIPAGMITPPVTAAVNELADKLGYIRVDEKWSVAETPPDLRLPVRNEPAARASARPAGDTRQMPRAYLLIGDRLQSGLFRVSDRFARRWGPSSGESFLVVATSPSGAEGSAKWRVDLAARTVTLADASHAGDSACGDAAWHIIGPADTWEQVIRGTANLNVALRRRELRYCDTGDGAPVTVTRIGMLADLLGITSWRSAESARRPQAVPAA
jgi:hypothetical protein